ncbi:hypothetical protein [Nocardioides speluncae]|uniref:hypothetical protein n=1 Tax=Nocardioides speluncae TaxID=2670337 RepID=UPI0019800085|nr:hypothetical protein [Nocardioides speluncae]
MSRDPADRSVIVVCANPCISLHDAAGAATAFASLWRVDWSPAGRGTALITWEAGRVQVYGEDLELAAWLEQEFVRHFPEVEGMPWPEPELVQTPVVIDIDLAHGCTASAADLTIEMGDVLARRTFTTDAFPLGEVEHSLSLVLAPCGKGEIRRDGRLLPGEIVLSGTPERPGSSAFTTDAEVWMR